MVVVEFLATVVYPSLCLCHVTAVSLKKKKYISPPLGIQLRTCFGQYNTGRRILLVLQKVLSGSWFLFGFLLFCHCHCHEKHMRDTHSRTGSNSQWEASLTRCQTCTCQTQANPAQIGHLPHRSTSKEQINASVLVPLRCLWLFVTQHCCDNS